MEAFAFLGRLAQGLRRLAHVVLEEPRLGQGDAEQTTEAIASRLSDLGELSRPPQ